LTLVGTLADEFLADMEDFDGADDEDGNDENAEHDHDDLDDDEKARQLIQDEIERDFGGGKQEKKLKFDNVQDFVKVWNSERLNEHMSKIEHFSALNAAAASTSSTASTSTIKSETNGGADQQQQQQQSLMTESAPEYQVIVLSNQVLVDIDNEIEQIYRFVRDLYSTKFPELESLVLHAMDYIRVVKAIGNELDLTRIDLTELLPANTIMVVSVTATTSSGAALPEDTLRRVMQACDVALALDAAKQRILAYVESRMSSVAPNLSALVGTSVAAKLMASAGGLAALSKLPAASVHALGAKKKLLAGMSTSTTITRHGFIGECALMAKTPPDLRVRAGRVIGGKCALAARVDAFQQDPTGAVGRDFYAEIDAKIAKWQEPPPGKKVKALVAPDAKKKARRAGKRVRRLKETLATSE
jgi:U4/U6 small nuclear ribonucleoprotein PRP31